MDMATVPVECNGVLDTAYIRLAGDADAAPARRIELDPWLVGGLLSVDLDERGRLVGVQVCEASELLRPELLQAGGPRQPARPLLGTLHRLRAW